MTTLYPAQVDTTITLPSVVNNLTPVNANSINILRDAILAIEEELGVNPAGIYTTVSARLDAIESGAGSSFIPGGDLSGSNINQTVIGIQGRPVSPTIPTLGQVLTWNGTAWIPQTGSAIPSGAAGGDLGSTYPNPSVVNINGASVPLAGSLTTGNTLQVSGSHALTYAPINLAGGANYVVGTLPVGNLPNLGGDVTGSPATNTVGKLQNRAVSNVAPTDGYALTWVAANSDWEPKPKIALGVPNLATLRTVIGTTNGTATMGGYYTVGDGGGGEFYWDNSSSTGDDGATIIVPTGSTTGRWQRIFDGFTINVLWFGAYGDNVHDDTAAIQAALNWGPGNFIPVVNFPARQFLLTAPANGVALYITKSVNMQGVLAVDNTQTGTVFNINGTVADGYTAGSGLLFEENLTVPPFSNPAGSILNNFVFNGYINLPRNTIIVHTVMTITNCDFANSCTQQAILIESGDAVSPWGTGNTSENNLQGLSYLPVSSYVLSDSCVVSNCGFYQSPNYTYIDTTVTQSFTQPGFSVPITLTVADSSQLTGTHYFLLTFPLGTQRNIIGVYQLNSVNSPTSITVEPVHAYDGSETPAGTVIPIGAQIQCGAAVHLRGSDTGICVVTNLSVLLSPISFKEGGQTTNTWIQCYSQDSRLGYFVYSEVFQPVFIHCGSEDFINSIITVPGAGALLISPTFASVNVGAYIEQTGSGGSNLFFERRSLSDGYLYGCQIPSAGSQSPLNMLVNDGAEVMGFGWAYNNAFDTLPYHVHSLIQVSDDSSGGGFGLTAPIHSRGKYLGMLCSASINTQRHWKWKQPYTLVPGINIVYINGGASDAGPFLFATNGTDVWTLAQSAVDVAIEYGNITDLTNNVCNFAGYSFIPESGGGGTNRNIACNIYNASGNTIAVSLVWSFDMFVTNFNYPVVASQIG